MVGVGRGGEGREWRRGEGGREGSGGEGRGGGERGATGQRPPVASILPLVDDNVI